MVSGTESERHIYLRRRLIRQIQLEHIKYYLMFRFRLAVTSHLEHSSIGCLIKPLAVNVKSACGLNQAVYRKQLYYLWPCNIAAWFIYTLLPEFIETKLFPEQTGQSAVAQRAGTAQLHLWELHLYRIELRFSDYGGLCKEHFLMRLTSIFIKYLVSFMLCVFLRRSNFAQIENCPLNSFFTGESSILD